MKLLFVLSAVSMMSLQAYGGSPHSWYVSYSISSSNERLVRQINEPSWQWAFFQPQHLADEILKRAHDPNQFVDLVNIFGAEIHTNDFRREIAKATWQSLVSSESLVPSGLDDTAVKSLIKSCGSSGGRRLNECVPFTQHLIFRNLDSLSQKYLGEVVANEAFHWSTPGNAWVISPIIMLLAAERFLETDEPLLLLLNVHSALRYAARVQQQGSDLGYLRSVKSKDGAATAQELRDRVLQKAIAIDPSATFDFCFREISGDMQGVIKLRAKGLDEDASYKAIDEDRSVILFYLTTASNSQFHDLLQEAEQIRNALRPLSDEDYEFAKNSRLIDVWTQYFTAARTSPQSQRQ